MRKEDVAAHLAAERRLRLFHFGFDRTVTGAPHDAVTATSRDVVVQRLAALHFAHDRRARHLGQHSAAEQNHEAVAPLHLPFAVDNTDAVAVSIKANRKEEQ